MAADQQSSDPLDHARPGAVRSDARWRRSVAWVIGGLLLLLLTATFLLPNLHRAPEHAYRLECRRNLRQIGQAIEMYAIEHAGKLPDDFSALLEAEDLSPAVFVCPETSAVPPGGPTTQAVVAAMKKPGAVSYIYLGKGLTSADLNQNPDTVLAYEPLSNHGSSGMNVLFGDGSVEWVQGPAAQKILTQASSAQRPVKLPQNQR